MEPAGRRDLRHMRKMRSADRRRATCRTAVRSLLRDMRIEHDPFDGRTSRALEPADIRWVTMAVMIFRKISDLVISCGGVSSHRARRHVLLPAVSDRPC